MEDRLEQPELDALWRFDDPVASAERFAMAAAEPYRSELVRAELETQRARALGLQGRFAEADALLESLEPAFGHLQVRILLERGRLRVTQNRPEDAVPLLEEALLAARRDDDRFLAVDAAHMLALADPGRGEQWTEEALADLRGVDDPRTLRWSVVLYNNRGWALLDAGDPSRALVAFRAAAEAAERYGTPDQRHAARYSLARCLRALDRPAEALALLRALASDRPEDAEVAAEIAALTAAEPTIES